MIPSLLESCTSFRLLLLIIIISIKVTAQPFASAFRLDKNELLKKNSDSSPQGNYIGSILTVGDTVFVVAGSGLSRTTDRGNSWTNFFNLTSLDIESVQTVAYSNGVIWTSFVKSIEKFGVMQTAGGGLKYSTDKGANWISIDQPSDMLSDTVILYGKNNLPAVPVHTDIENLTYDIAIINNVIWIASWGGGLRKSSDMGKSWQRVVLPPDNLDMISPEEKLDFTVASQNLNYRAFSIAVADSLTFYVGTAGGVNKTTDGGISWRKFNHLNQSNPISGNFVNCLKYNPVTNTLYASSWKATGSTEFYAVSFSSNGGESWTTVLEGERPTGFGFKGEDVIVTTENGAFRSSNMGKSWLSPDKIIDRQAGLSITTNYFTCAASQKDDIWLGSKFGLARLSETGAMWNGPWKIFMASQPLPSKNSSYAFPNPFHPDETKVNIKYSTGGRRANVTIRIFDFGMNLVRTVIQNEERGNFVTTGNSQENSLQDDSVIDLWDGKNERGDFVPNGVYFYKIDFDQGEPTFGKIMVLM
ncbi:MAG: hypothetical protein Q8858_08475 [Bacteroidota bacterium]|nr:hypothetical protein [Bacteroidota bacterium]